ncbi:hypothetical protein [Variovorax beijingensis]|uniref:hypothetical protein n=1 Tax=Variovorax beijingensis TaxID=2496117 RepID=UPI001639BCC0|nr:hypothetical protein [Variovorax beijingensis]
MCYSAQIRADYKRFFRQFGGVLSLRAFAKLYYERQGNPRIKIPKAVDAAFMNPESDEEREEIKGLIEAFDAEQRRMCGLPRRRSNGVWASWRT